MDCLRNTWLLCASTKSSRYSPCHFIPLWGCVRAGHFVQHWHSTAMWRRKLLNSFITFSFQCWVEMRGFDQEVASQDQLLKEKEKWQMRLHYYVASPLVVSYHAVLQGRSVAMLKQYALPAYVRGTLVASPGRCCGNECAWGWHRLGCTMGHPPDVAFPRAARAAGGGYHSSGSDCCWWLLGLFPG